MEKRLSFQYERFRFFFSRQTGLRKIEIPEPRDKVVG